MVPKAHIAIIGGGIAGLSCAYFLKKQGLDAVRVEGIIVMAITQEVYLPHLVYI